MDNSIANTNEVQNLLHKSCEAKYQDLKSDYEELENHKKQILAIRDDQIAKYRKQINNLENVNETLSESMTENSKKIKQQEKIIIDTNKLMKKSEALQEVAENKFNELIKQWKEIDLTEFYENSKLNTEKIKKYISSYQNEIKILNEKVVALEESLKNLESEKEMNSRILENEKKNRQSWFSLGIFGKRNENLTDIDGKPLGINEDVLNEEKKKNFTKILTIYNCEKADLLKTSEEYKMKINQLEKELEKEKNFCNNLREKAKIFKDENQRLKTQCVNVSPYDLDEKLKIKEEELKRKSNYIKELTEKICTLENKLQETEEINKSLLRDKNDIQRKYDVIDMEYEQLLLKKESLETHINDLEKSKPIVAAKKMKVFEIKPSPSKSFEDEIKDTKDDRMSTLDTDNLTHDTKGISHDHLACGLCQRYFPPDKIEQHFNSCISEN